MSVSEYRFEILRNIAIFNLFLLLQTLMMPILRWNIYMLYWFLFDCCLVLRLNEIASTIECLDW